MPGQISNRLDEYISKRLHAYIEASYLHMLQVQEEEQPKKVAHRKDKDAKTKEISRSAERDLEDIESLLERGLLDESCYCDTKSKILADGKKKKEQLKKEYKENSKDLLEGKELGYLNLFVFKCWYLIRKEILPQNIPDFKISEIDDWIKDFLKSKNYQKQNPELKKTSFYTLKDIQRIIKIFQKGKESQYIKHFASLIDHIYDNPKVAPIPYPE